MTTRPALPAINTAIKLPRELLGSVPREVRLTRGGVAIVSLAAGLAIGALVVAIAMSVISLRSARENAARDSSSVAASATVTDIAITRDSDRRRTVIYSYQANGRSFVDRQRLRQSDRRTLRQGDAIQIRYLPSQPQDSWLPGYQTRGVPPFVIPLVAVSLLLAAAAIGRTIRRQWILLSEGRAALARIVAHQQIRKDKRRAYRVTCEFETLSGARRTAKYQTTAAPPAVGSMVPILYHRDDPKWTSSYPVAWVKPIRLG